MTALPVIVGFGGFNASGRSSFHHGYRRTVLESLDQVKQDKTLLGLACMMKLVEHDNGLYRESDGTQLSAEQVVEKYRSTIEQNTLVRRVHESHFDADNVPANRKVDINNADGAEFTIARRDLPNPIPVSWQVDTLDDKQVKVTMNGDMSVSMQHFRVMDVQSAGTLPTGFDPAAHYNSRFHPRGLQMAVIGSSDAINSIGIPWQTIQDSVDPDQIGVFAASGLGQTDEDGIGGYMKARLKSKRPTSKQMALGLNSMPADFINAYVCGGVGTTGAMAGACATFLYNLRLAVDDIATGRLKVAIVGSSEAPVTPEVMEGFAAMSALGTDERIARLDGRETADADHRRASRPFGDNCGFTMGESTQYFVLMSDDLAVKLGAEIYGAVPNVFVNADGYKKSISSPGAGNYITLAKAVASAQAIVGKESVQQRSFVQAHGSSTPQNRVTESIIFDKVAKGFDIENWPVTAIKAFVGHPLGPASGDQLAGVLGTFADDIIPGIKTTEKIADDVVDENLEILLKDKQTKVDVAFLNTKGFGGNNATASIIAPHIVDQMLEKRYGADEITSYQTKREAVRKLAAEYDQQAINGEFNVIYNFGEGIIEEDKIVINADSLSMNEFTKSVNLNMQNPYQDMS